MMVYKVECSSEDCDYWAEWTFDFPIEVKTGDYWPYYEPECPNCDSPMVLVDRRGGQNAADEDLSLPQMR